MEEFRQYLQNSRAANTNALKFYVLWVTHFLNYCNKHPDDEFNEQDIDAYLKSLTKKYEQWQVDQARQAIEIYRFWKSRRERKAGLTRLDTRDQWKIAAEDMHNIMRLKHLALKTEQTYLNWVRKFYWFVNGEPPGELKSNHVKDFLTHLAVERKVAASTQNQAFSALLFLFRHVLDKPLDDISEAIRVNKKRRLPVVLTQPEVERLLTEMSGVNRLMAQIIYGGGLRLKECVQLRVKDIDINRKTVVIRRGKGDKDRETVLPGSILSDLKLHFEEIQSLYDKDRECNQAGVELPGALERKWPLAGREWAWFWVFPSYKLSADPVSGQIRRHHVHPSVLQKHLKKAAIKAEIHKRVTVHTLRHCFATHLIEQGCDVRTIQELLGHSHLETTMIYTHVAQTNRLGIISPLDSGTQE